MLLHGQHSTAELQQQQALAPPRPHLVTLTSRLCNNNNQTLNKIPIVTKLFFISLNMLKVVDKNCSRVTKDSINVRVDDDDDDLLIKLSNHRGYFIYHQV